MAQFSTNESVSLEKQLNLPVKPIENDLDKINEIYEIEKCVSWIQTNNFKKVSLQFPDHLLPDSSTIALKIQEQTGQTVYILGDTAYESCCIDYITASHVNSDAIIHFGAVCFSENAGNLPVLYIYEQIDLNVEHLETCLSGFNEGAILLLDNPYFCYFNELAGKLKKFKIVQLQRDYNEHLDTIIYLGSNDLKLLNIFLTLNPKKLFFYDAKKVSPKLELFEFNNNLLKRRNYLMETIKDSKIIGIVIGTLGVKNYLKIIERMKQIILLNKKKYYLISVGKPTIAKLANFLEIDCFCIVTCSLNEIYNKRDFFKPIVTPYDVECALNSHMTFSLDFNDLLDNPVKEFVDSTDDVSLITGKLRQFDYDVQNEASQDVNVKNNTCLLLTGNSGSGFLAGRQWKGLEQNFGGSQVEFVQEGRKGVAQCYENEKDS